MQGSGLRFGASLGPVLLGSYGPLAGTTFSPGSPEDAPTSKRRRFRHLTNKETHLHDQVNDPTAATAPSSSPAATPQAPGFKEVRKYIRNMQQREALGGFIEAGWTPAELGEFARQVFLAPGKTYPTAASYQYAMEKGADHPFAIETLSSLRAPSFTMPPFDRPRREAAW